MTSVISQFVAVVCGLIVPQLLIRTYGSESYGAVTSATQFLAYITLLEGGIGGLARSELYKSLATKDITATNSILREFKKFYFGLSIGFVFYTAVLASVFYHICNSDSLTWKFCFSIVCVLSISTMIEYCFGVTAGVLLQADQKTYVSTIYSIGSKIINTVLVVLMVQRGYGLVTVYLVSSLVYILKTLLINTYVKKNYPVNWNGKGQKTKYLSQKKEAFGQHIAYYIHTKTDVIVLTLFLNLREVAVYSIYNYISSSISGIVKSVFSGSESLFGELIAKGNLERLRNQFDKVEFLNHTIMTVLFSVTLNLFLPFVKLYTGGVTDADYMRPVLMILIVLTGIINIVRQPYFDIITAAGRFKETQLAAYIEAVLNVVLSCLLVNVLGVEGVILATAISLSYRGIYFVWYLRRNILFRSERIFVKRCIVSIVIILLSYVAGTLIPIDSERNYLMWATSGVVSVVLAAIITLCVSYIFYKKETKWMIRRFIHKREG
jgi:O-antigen/teichoic acid export membrane protein